MRILIDEGASQALSPVAPPEEGVCMTKGPGCSDPCGRSDLEVQGVPSYRAGSGTNRAAGAQVGKRLDGLAACLKCKDLF